MQRKLVKKTVSGYCAGKGKTNQELIYLHMSNHYRRILNAKKVIDNSPPHSFKSKRPSTSNPAVARNKLNRPLDSPALTDRSASTNSYKGSFWGMESCLGSSRYHSQCVSTDSTNVAAHADRIGIDMNLINRITYDTKHGPGAYCDERRMELKAQDCRKVYQTAYEMRQNKANVDSFNSKNHPPIKNSDESAQKQKFVIQRKKKVDETAVGSKCSASSNRDGKAKESKIEAVSKLRSLRVYHPPRRKKTRSKAETPSNPMEASSCDCTKICICDANETAFKKAPTSGKEQSQTSSRDSAYNGGISSLPESRSPTPDHRRKVDCCCCCCEKKQRDVRPDFSKPVEESPRVRETYSSLPTPKPKAQQHQESLRKMKEDALYVKFLQDITVEVLERNLYTNKALKKVMKKHLRKNIHKLNKERMLQEVDNLRIQLGIPEDKALLDLEADAEEGSSDLLKPYPIISDSEFMMPKNLIAGNEKKSAERLKFSPKTPKSISEVLSTFEDENVFVSETDEELISVIQMKKALGGEKRKETSDGKSGLRAGQGHSSDDSDRPSNPKKRSTTYGVKQKLMRTYSSSSSDSDMGKKPLGKVSVDNTEEDVSVSEDLLREFTQKNSSMSADRKNRSVSFWHNPDVNVSRTKTIEIKHKKTITCSRSGSPGNEQREK